MATGPSAVPSAVPVLSYERQLPTVRLYRPSAVSLATFLGSLIGGGILMAINFKRLRNREGAKWAVVSTAAGTAALVVAGFLLPEGFPSTGIAIGGIAAMHQMAKMQQGESIERHVAAGGDTEPWYKALMIGLGTGVALLVVVFLIVVMLEVVGS